MGNVILMAVLVSVGVLLSAVQNKLVKNNVKNMSDNFAYVTVIYTVGTAVMFIDGGRFACAPLTRILGIVTGFLIIGEGVFSVNALRYGPMSLTNMLSMSSMVIPMIPAGILWNEPMNALQIFAAVLMLVSMACILNLFGKKKESTFGNIDPRFPVFGLLCFLCGGLMGFPQKYQTMSAYSSEIISYLLYAFLTTAVLAAVCALFTVKKKGQPVTMKFTPKLLAGIAGCGVMTALLHILTMEALNRIPIAIVLTVSNGGRLILVTLVDMFWFKQNLNRQQLLGIGLGVIAILLLSI